MNKVPFYLAFAFCAWDGRRLLTEAEWEYAAAGGEENRLFPWGSAVPVPNGSLAHYCLGTNANTAKITVGSYPLGNGRWGQADQAGSLWEWTRDAWSSTWYTTPSGNPCSNCANLASPASLRLVRGGSYQSCNEKVRAAYRDYADGATSMAHIGLRCGR
jgi:formylglycine-generating enzyme